MSDWKELNAGVPQGTLVGPAAFLCMINDAVNSQDSNVISLKYVDDLTLMENSQIGKASVIHDDLHKFESWSETNNMSLNPTKCMSMTVCFSRQQNVHVPLTIADKDLAEVDVVKILGVQISADLKWDTHIGAVIKRASSRLYMLSTLKKFNMPVSDLITVYVGYVRPLVEYAVPIWHGALTCEQTLAIERIQKRACRIILGFINYSSYEEALQTCNLERLAQRRDKICLDFAHKLMDSDIFREWLPEKRTTNHGRDPWTKIDCS
jgi:hypothetical protein